jgi:hypothetical protein
MAEADNVFAGAMPEIYDAYLVPLIFQPMQRISHGAPPRE